MKIVVDTNLPLGRTLFGTLGEVKLVDGAHLTHEVVKDAELLMVREAPIGAPLLEGSTVRFVGSAITGSDHIDKPWMMQAGIRWVNAPRANGESVADYCLAALLEYGHMRHRTLEGATVALIGVGWIGTMVRDRCLALGMNVLCCDPPRKDSPYDAEAQTFQSLEAILPQADYIIPFVPLTHDGPYPTWHMLNRETLALAKDGAVLINMARGAVCDTDALLEALRSGKLSDGIFDVWEDEPNFSRELAEQAFLATPHLAGHSYEGKVNGTVVVYHAACAYLGKQPSISPTLPPPPVPRIDVDGFAQTDEEALWFVTQRLSMIVADHLAFSESFTLDPAARRRRFASLRHAYRYRRQFSATTVVIHHSTPALIAKFKGLGFQVETK